MRTCFQTLVCDFGQLCTYTLLIPLLLDGTLPPGLLSLEFNAKEELWANFEQEARFPGSTVQSCKCTKKRLNSFPHHTASGCQEGYPKSLLNP